MAFPTRVSFVTGNWYLYPECEMCVARIEAWFILAFMKLYNPFSLASACLFLDTILFSLGIVVNSRRCVFNKKTNILLEGYIPYF